MNSSTVLVTDTPDREDLEIQRLKRQIREFQDRLEEVETRKRQRTTVAIASPPPLATPSPPPTIIPDDDDESDDEEVEVIKSYISVGQFVHGFLRASAQGVSQKKIKQVGQVTSALYRGKYCRDKSFASVYNTKAQLSKPMQRILGSSGFMANAYEDIDTHLIEKAFHLVVKRGMALSDVLASFRRQGWGFLQQVVGRSCTMDIFEALVEKVENQ